MITWFAFLADEILLPDRFSSKAAIARAQRRLRTYVPKSRTKEASPEPLEGIKELIHAFDSPSIPDSLPLKRRSRRKLEALRNRALLYALADSGAHIIEVLRLTADDIQGARDNDQGIWSIEVRGKGRRQHGRMVTLRFTSPALEAMKEYLKARADPGAITLFVSYAKTRPQFRCTPLSPNAAWRMIQEAARDLGLSHIHPHDFRH